MAECDLNSQRLRELLHYDPETGIFTRLTRSRAVAGNPTAYGYLQLMVAGKMRSAHRLAWLYMTGEMPTMDVDHINGVRSDNRWVNLRHVDRSVNAQNQRSAHRDSLSGLAGAYMARGRWYASISFSGKTLSLGSFSTAEDAHAYYLEVKRRLHDGCTV